MSHLYFLYGETKMLFQRTATGHIVTNHKSIEVVGVELWLTGVNKKDYHKWLEHLNMCLKS
jgi:hypothetical protein